jgi:hypothetical protein
MDKNINKIAQLYSIIRESESINNNIQTGASTKFAVDHNSRFVPIGQDIDEEELGLESDKILKDLEPKFAELKSLIEACQGDKKSLQTVSMLADFLDNPDFKGKLNDLKMAVQKENMNNGINTRLSSSF